MSTPFENEERRSKLAVMPKSVNHGQVVKLSPKKLTSDRATRTVLPEEQYLSKLEKIIVKDYFPELPKLKAQSEYMDAVARNDVAKMRELQLRFNTQRRTDRRTSPSFRRGTSPGAAPPTSPLHFDPDTPGPSRNIEDESPLPFANREGDNERQSEKEKKKKSELEGLTIDGYLNKFTSEDNASFEELTALAERRRRANKAWVYEAEDAHNRDMVTRGAIAASADLQLALKYDTEADKEKPKELDNWAYTAHNHCLFYPEGAKLTPEEQALNAKRSQRVINRTATRFPDDLKNRPSESSMARAAMQQVANNAGKVDILGHEVTLPSKTLGLVATPTPVPGVADSPLMTWGEIDGTPFRLDATDVQAPLENAPAFKMPEVPYREQVAQEMTDTIARRYREKRKTAMQCAEKAHRTPRFGSSRCSSERLSMLSPAARKLASNQLGIRLGSGKSNKTLGTPSPGGFRRPSSSTKTPAGNKTPVASMIRRMPANSTSNKKNLTDNLMAVEVDDDASSARVPKDGNRASAGDFF